MTFSFTFKEHGAILVKLEGDALFRWSVTAGGLRSPGWVPLTEAEKDELSDAVLGPE